MIYEEIMGDMTEKSMFMFASPTCNPCMKLRPVLTKISIKHDVGLMYLDITKYQDIAQEYGVTGVPTVVLFKGDDEVNRFVGFADGTDYQEMILGYLNT